LNVDGKWPADMERLNNSVRNGAISSATSFITETGSGSAAELLSGRRDIAETMSSAVTEVNDTTDVPSGTREKSGSGAPSVLDRTALTFSEKKTAEFVNSDARTRWRTSTAEQLVNVLINWNLTPGMNKKLSCR